MREEGRKFAESSARRRFPKAMATNDDINENVGVTLENRAASHKRDQPQRVRGAEVFVGGLQRSVTEEQIRELFSDCGEISEVRMIRDQTGTLKGYCFVRFTTRSAALKAQKEKTGIVFQGKTIGVKPPSEQDTLFLGNLRKDWTSEELEKMVRQAFQDVHSVVLAMPISTGESPNKKQQNRGFAFVHFNSSSAAARAHRIATKPEFLLGGKWKPIVDWAETEPEPDPDEMAKVTTAFVGNVPDSVTEEFLQGLFEPFGKIERVAISKRGNTPVGFVQFVNRDDLEASIEELHGKLVDGPGKGPKFKLQVSVAKPVDKSRKRNKEENQNATLAKAPGRGKAAPKVAGPAFSDQKLGNTTRARLPFAVPEVFDQYDLAVALLKPVVADRLTHLFRQGFASRQEVDMNILQGLKELSEAAAVKALDQFASSNFSDPISKAAYLTGLIDMARREVIENLSLQQFPLKAARPIEVSPLGRVGGMKEVGALPSSRFLAVDQLSLPFGGVENDLSRYDPYGSLATAGLYAPLSVGVGAETLPRYPTAFAEPLSLVGMNATYATGNLHSGFGAAVNQEASATECRTVKFDPFTGEPYKFDPFTGQPVQPSGSSSTHLGGKFF